MSLILRLQRKLKYLFSTPKVNQKCALLSVICFSLIVFNFYCDYEAPEDLPATITKADPGAIIDMGNRTVIRSDIAVLVTVNVTKDWLLYWQAQSSLECYCKMYNYSLIQLALDALPSSIMNECQQKDYFFRRHCVARQIFKMYPQIKWFVFLGADIGIINPRHSLEEYINDNYDMTFYERGFNYDIMADSYIAKNNEHSLQFLQDWVEFDWKNPGAYPGVDNGPIHQVFVDKLRPNSPRNGECYNIWLSATNYDEEQQYVACARSILNDTLNFDRVRIISKFSRKSWARDGWLTQSLWSPKDFMFHGWKIYYFYNWPDWYGATPNPMLPNVTFPLDECLTIDQGVKIWDRYYNATFKARSDEEVYNILESKFNLVKNNYTAFVATLKNAIE